MIRMRARLSEIHNCEARVLALAAKTLKREGRQEPRVVRLHRSSLLRQSSNLIFIWGLIGLAYPLYNAFLPTYLAARNGVGGSSGVNSTYRDYAIISTCGIPGSILAAWFVELPRSGRKGALAVSTLITGVFVFALTGAPNNAAYLALNCIAACFQVSVMWLSDD